MKYTAGIILLLIVVIGVWYSILLRNFLTQQSHIAMQTPVATTTPQIIPIMHATALIQWGTAALYTDPIDAKLIQGKPAADIVLVTDIHGDHFSTTTLAALLGTSTALIVPQAVYDLLTPELAARAQVLKNGETIQVQGFTITGVPMYNIPESSKAFHAKGRGNGYVIEKAGERVYVAGDTSNTPEMRALKNIDIALVPMNLPYTMSVEEAAQAVLAFMPRHVYPYHYRGADGLSDIATFKTLVNAGDPNIDVVLANWYPQQ